MVYTMPAVRGGVKTVRWWDGRVPLLRREVGPPTPQHVLLNLTRGGLWQFRHEREAMGRLEMGQVPARELPELLRRGGRSRLEDDEGVGRLAPVGVGQAHNARFLHRRMPQQHRFDLDRRDIFAATDDHVLETVA